MVRMRRRKRAKSDTQFKGPAVVGGIGLGALHRFALTACRRLIGQHDVNGPLLSLVLRLIGPQGRASFVETVAPIFDVRPAKILTAVDDEESDDKPTTLGELLHALEEDLGVDVLGDSDSHDAPPEFFPLGFISDEKRVSPWQLGKMIMVELERAEDPDEAEVQVERMLSKFVDEALASAGGETEHREMAELADAFGLNEAAEQVILFFLAYGQIPTMESFCDEHCLSDWSRLIATACGTSLEQTQKILADDGPLMRSGILHRQDNDVPPYYSLARPVVDFLTGLGGKPLAEHFVRVDKEPTFAVDSFPVAPDDLQVMQALVNGDKPRNILILGLAGTGKTEFTKSLISAAGKKICFVETGKDGKPQERRVALAGGATLAQPSESVLVVDEADSLMNTDDAHRTEGVDKGWINQFMDGSQAIIIWIANRVSSVPASIRRRFDYSLKFKAFTRVQRVNMWNQVLSGSPLENIVDGEMRERLAAAYEANAAGIAAAIDATASIVPAEVTQEDVEKLLGQFLLRHQELVTGKAPRKPRLVGDNYRPDALNLSGNRKAIERALSLATKTRSSGDTETRINLLFWGRPGTGKTEYARHLAAMLDVQLIVKTGAELLSMWVGETEKLIAAAFEEAEREEAILFIDEADSFFTERSTAARSWEVTQTNELLQQMENHKGILICCTNFLHGLDKAALRRFDWKIEFKPLDEARLLTIYHEYFGDGRPTLSTSQRGRLTAMSGVTFGDFRAVVGRLRFEKASALSHDILIAALEEEVSYRKGDGDGKKLGFR